jgi:hypothetical protein
MLRAAATLGYSSLDAYSDQRPEMTYYQIVAELGEVAGREFAPVQVENLLRDAAVTPEQIQRFARGSFVRHLRKLMPEGWNNGADSVFNFAHALGAWISRLPTAYAEQCQRVGRQLRLIQPAKGWLPNGPDDPLVAEAFRQADFRALALR